MKKIIIFGFLSLLLNNVFSQKDPLAWKTEKSLESQYLSLKNNVSQWNGFIMIKEPVLNDFHKSIIDSVQGLEKIITNVNSEILESKKKVDDLSEQLSSVQAELKTSLSKEAQLSTLGMSFDKDVFPTVMYSIIVIALLIGVFAFFMFFRSNAMTRETEKRYQDLTEELKVQKTRALERESKLARELQTERNKHYN